MKLMKLMKRNRRPFLFLKIILSKWFWLIVTPIVSAVAIFFFIVVMISQFQEPKSSESDFGGAHLLSPETLAWQGDVEAELRRQGLDNSWTMIVLGIIQAESGGNASTTPDIMQSSESKGLAPNTINNPKESIKVGIEALHKAILAGNELGISDKKAILQGYNFNHAFLSWMKRRGKTRWTIDLAEEYSRTVVVKALMGRVGTEVDKRQYNAPWAQETKKPYLYRNGGNFHYPNIIYHYISGGSGIGDINFTGKFVPPYQSYTVTSEFGYRTDPIRGGSVLHGGIDLVGHEKNIRAVAAGVVVENRNNGNVGWGNYIVIKHGTFNGKEFYTLYAHMSRQSPVPVGTKVAQGQVIGTEGSTGYSTGSHLHLEVYVTQPGEQRGIHHRQNPRRYIQF